MSQDSKFPLATIVRSHCLSRIDYDFSVPSESIQLAALVPHHDLIERIGRGGYGEVWLARKRTIDTLRAVKSPVV